MARKLIAVAALVALVSLASAGAALADTYQLGPQGDSTEGNWTWVHMYTGKEPWSSNTQFAAGSPRLPSDENTVYPFYWSFPYFNDAKTIRYLTNSSIGTYVLPVGDNWGSFTVVFNSSSFTPRFVLDGDKIPGVPDDIIIKSNDFTLTYSAEYKIQQLNTYTVNNAVIIGEGHNWPALGGEAFWFRATLNDAQGNHQNSGYMTSFTLKFPYDPSAVPLPAGVWLLGTGLLGLACLGRRRRK